MTTFIIIAALNQDRVIAIDGVIPWDVHSDMQRFKRLTMQHPVLMGRKTWDSLPERFRPLPGRANVVLTRDPAHARMIRAAGAAAVASLDEARRLVAGDDTAIIIGGGEIYRQALAFAERMELTWISMRTPKGRDLTRFPEWDPAIWKRVGFKGHPAKQGATDSHYSTYETIERAMVPA